MDEVRSIPWNGLTVASTFSGAGGSCTGYRMAGYRVVWANEFVPIAQESYKANASPHCFLDHRDITTVTAKDILQQIGMEPGELDLFDGSPPCQAFSTAGQRDKGWGKEKSYEHGAKQCNEQLFDHYIRLLGGLQPKVFVAENVSGLVKGTAKGFFLEILAGLKAAGYKVSCKVLDAQWLGVPQTRTRTIFVGVRNDLGLDPVHPKPLPYRYSVRDALLWIEQALHDESGKWSTGDVTDTAAPCVRSGRAGTMLAVQSGAYPKTFKDGNLPSPAVVAARTTTISTTTERRKFTIDEVKAICSFPPDFILCGKYAQQWERLGNSVPPLMMRAIASEIRDRILLPLKARSHG
jgi:DNA (cytosine-5)-methyltransferase 1